jgi:hypothetical protein
MSQAGLVYIAVGIVMLLVIVVVVRGRGSSSTTTPKPIAPFMGWAKGGNQYYIDYANPVNQSWTGMTSSDTTPIQCTGSLSDTQCETDLATAGQVCDNTDGCIGIIYNITDPTSPTATPVNTTPTTLSGVHTAAEGGGAVFLTPSVPTNAYLSLTGVPNTTWTTNNIATLLVNGIGISKGQSIVECYLMNQKSKGSCGGVLIPDYTSTYQQTHLNNGYPPLVGMAGALYDTLNTSTAPSTSFTTAIALTYNDGSG